MSKGENIFKRKDGRWEARYIRDRSPSGKIIYGFCYGKTYREAKEKVTKLRASEKPAAQTVTEQPMISVLSAGWLDKKRSEVKESTIIKYECIVTRHINPALGDCAPDRLTAGRIDEFSRGLLKSGLSAKTVHDILVVLRGVLVYAAAIAGNGSAVPRIRYPARERKEMRVLTREEQSRLVGYLRRDMDDCKFGVLLTLLSGMRLGEICALRWENIAADERTITVASTLHRLRDTMSSATPQRTRITTGTPKSATSSRTIPMTAQTAELCDRMRHENGAAYILTGSERCMEPRTLQYRMKKYARDCGLDGVHFHTLRHTFATRAIEAGFEIKSLSEILGNSTTTITLDRYVHSSLELKRENMRKLSEIGM